MPETQAHVCNRGGRRKRPQKNGREGRSVGMNMLAALAPHRLHRDRRVIATQAGTHPPSESLVFKASLGIAGSKGGTKTNMPAVHVNMFRHRSMTGRKVSLPGFASMYIRIVHDLDTNSPKIFFFREVMFNYCNRLGSCGGMRNGGVIGQCSKKAA